MAPAGVDVSAIPVAVPEQIVCTAGVAVATGVGFTVMVTSTGIPGQVPSIGVIV